MIREFVKELAKTAHNIGIYEWNNTPLNTYERQYLYEFLSNDTLLSIAEYYNKHTMQSANPSTYNETVVSILFPELIRRLAAVPSNSKLKEKVAQFLTSSSWYEYRSKVESITMHGNGCEGVQVGIMPFEDLERAYNNS